MYPDDLNLNDLSNKNNMYNENGLNKELLDKEFLNLRDISVPGDYSEGVFPRSRIFATDIEESLHYYFSSVVEELPNLNRFHYRKSALAIYKEYSFFNESRRILVNLKGEWKEIEFEQFLSGLRSFLEENYKEDKVEKLIKEIKNLRINENFN